MSMVYHRAVRLYLSLSRPCVTLSTHFVHEQGSFGRGRLPHRELRTITCLIEKSAGVGWGEGGGVSHVALRR